MPPKRYRARRKPMPRLRISPESVLRLEPWLKSTIQSAKRKPSKPKAIAMRKMEAPLKKMRLMDMLPIMELAGPEPLQAYTAYLTVIQGLAEHVPEGLTGRVLVPFATFDRESIEGALKNSQTFAEALHRLTLRPLQIRGKPKDATATTPELLKALLWMLVSIPQVFGVGNLDPFRRALADVYEKARGLSVRSWLNLMRYGFIVGASLLVGNQLSVAYMAGGTSAVLGEAFAYRAWIFAISFVAFPETTLLMLAHVILEFSKMVAGGLSKLAGGLTSLAGWLRNMFKKNPDVTPPSPKPEPEPCSGCSPCPSCDRVVKQLEAEKQATQAKISQALTQTDTRYAQEISEINADHAEAVENLEANHAEAIKQVLASAGMMAKAEQAQAIAAVKAEYEQARTDMQAEHEQARTDMQAEHAAELAGVRAEHAAELSVIEAAADGELAVVKARQTQERTEIKDEQIRKMAAVREQKDREIANVKAEADAKQARAVEAVKTEYEQKLDVLTAEHTAKREAADVDHAAELGEQAVRIVALEGQLSATEGQLQNAHNQLRIMGDLESINENLTKELKTVAGERDAAVATAARYERYVQDAMAITGTDNPEDLATYIRDLKDDRATLRALQRNTRIDTAERDRLRQRERELSRELSMAQNAKRGLETSLAEAAEKIGVQRQEITSGSEAITALQAKSARDETTIAENAATRQYHLRVIESLGLRAEQAENALEMMAGVVNTTQTSAERIRENLEQGQLENADLREEIAKLLLVELPTVINEMEARGTHLAGQIAALKKQGHNLLVDLVNKNKDLAWWEQRWFETKVAAGVFAVVATGGAAVKAGVLTLPAFAGEGTGTVAALNALGPVPSHIPGASTGELANRLAALGGASRKLGGAAVALKALEHIPGVSAQSTDYPLIIGSNTTNITTDDYGEPGINTLWGWVPLDALASIVETPTITTGKTGLDTFYGMGPAFLEDLRGLGQSVQASIEPAGRRITRRPDYEFISPEEREYLESAYFIHRNLPSDMTVAEAKLYLQRGPETYKAERNRRILQQQNPFLGRSLLGQMSPANQMAIERAEDRSSPPLRSSDVSLPQWVLERARILWGGETSAEAYKPQQDPILQMAFTQPIRPSAEAMARINNTTAVIALPG